MASTSPKGFTQYDNSSSMDGPNQINAAELFVENLIGESEPTASALPADGKWLGRHIFVEDEAADYVWTSSGWAKPGGDTGWLNVSTYNSGWSAVTSSAVPWAGVKYRKLNGIVYVSGPCIKNAAVTVLETAFVLPTGFRPAVTIVGQGQLGSTDAFAICTPDGSVKPTIAGAASSQFTIGLSFPV